MYGCLLRYIGRFFGMLVMLFLVRLMIRKGWFIFGWLKENEVRVFDERLRFFNDGKYCGYCFNLCGRLCSLMENNYKVVSFGYVLLLVKELKNEFDKFVWYDFLIDFNCLNLYLKCLFVFLFFWWVVWCIIMIVFLREMFLEFISFCDIFLEIIWMIDFWLYMFDLLYGW